MRKYKVKDTFGNIHIIAGPEDATPTEIESEAERLIPKQVQQPFRSQIPEIVKQAGQTALASSPANLTQKFMQVDPATMQKVAGPALPIVGGIVGDYPGAIGGEALRQFTGTALAPETVPKTTLGRATSMGMAGIMQEPKILGAIPGVPKVVELAKRSGSAVGQGLARLGEAASGVPKREIERLFRNPSQVFTLGSKAKAGEAIGKAKEAAGINPGVTEALESMTPTNVKKALNVEKVGSVALERVTKSVAKGGKLTPEDITDSLKFVSDKIKKGLREGTDTSELQNLQGHLNKLLELSDEGIASARKEFAPLALRDKFLSLFPKNKDGSISKANLFYLNSLLGTLGYAAGGKEGATTGILAGMAGRSPLTTGLATVGASGLVKGLNILGQNPALRQTLLGILQNMMQKKQANGQ